MTAKKQHTLLIVESPAKAKTIEKYLGSGYTVMASMGHLIDLPKSRLAIDVDKDFEPEYITVRGKAKILKELQAKASKTGHILLASDNDREGEAISFHLERAFRKKKPDLKIERIIFNEITPHAIKEAVKRPGEISMAKVNAQKARRVLDRIVGYNLSPILWQKVKNGLSAGRVQSVALRLICEREKEVENFIPEEYWSLDAVFAKGKSHFSAQLVKLNGEKLEIKNEEEAQNIIASLKGETFRIGEVRSVEKSQKPRPPFTTSQLQQTAANRLGFTSKKTMQIAQQLYEGVNIGSSRIGLITYMRTDSTRISETALAEVREYLAKHFPDETPGSPNIYTMGRGAQDAHEAIRPTMVAYTPDYVREHLTRDQLKLYSIIWERYLSCQMEASRSLTVSVDIEAAQAVFRASSTQTTYKGFQRVLKLLAAKETGKKLPKLETGELVEIVNFSPEQHFTAGPARYTDATIVKALEEKGIGRPSTYAPIISVLLDRHYVVRKNRQLVPTALGKNIHEILFKAFSDVIDVNFTANMEAWLDEVEENRSEWVGMIKDFYAPFKEKVEHVMETLESIKGVMDEPTDHICEKCSRPMVKKLGRFGFFIACTGFPECKNTKSIPLADCPRPGCDGKIVARKKARGRGREFFGCTKYPQCDFITHFKPTSSNCPQCGMFLVEKYDKKRGSHKACINPDCAYLHSVDEEEENVRTDE